MLDAFGATFVADDDAFASSSAELSTDCTTVSSAVDSPAASAATSPLKVHVVSALDPAVILDVVFQTPTSVCRQSLWLVTCVRAWYRWFDIRAHLTERNEVDVVCPDKLDSGTQHQRPEQPLQANSV